MKCHARDYSDYLSKGGRFFEGKIGFDPGALSNLKGDEKFQITLRDASPWRPRNGHG
jgi:hypothetical protein